jgi:hypothetical protein
MLVRYRNGDMWSLQLETTEALTVTVQDFLMSIEAWGESVTNSAVGLPVVRILETITRSMALKSKLVERDWYEDKS